MYQCFFVLLNLIFISAFKPHWAQACSCMAANPYGFLSDQDELLLPVNAKGVLYYHNSGAVTSYIAGKKVLTRMPRTQLVGQFILIHLKTKKQIPVTVTPLVLPLRQWQVGPYYKFNQSMDRCASQSTQFCQTLRNHDLTDEEKSNILNKNNYWQEVTKELQQVPSLFRIEPTEAFQAGEEYRLTYQEHATNQQSFHFMRPSKNQVNIRVSPKTVDTQFLSKIYLEKLKGAGPPEVSISDQGMCTKKVAAVVSQWRWVVPDEIKEFSHLLRFFSFVSSNKMPERPWRYQPHSCHVTGFGRTVNGDGRYGFYGLCAKSGVREMGDHSGLKFGVRYQVKGGFGLFEVRDELFETSKKSFTLSSESCEL